VPSFGTLPAISTGYNSKASKAFAPDTFS